MSLPRHELLPEDLAGLLDVDDGVQDEARRRIAAVGLPAEGARLLAVRRHLRTSMGVAAVLTGVSLSGLALSGMVAMALKMGTMVWGTKPVVWIGGLGGFVCVGAVLLTLHLTNRSRARRRREAESAGRRLVDWLQHTAFVHEDQGRIGVNLEVPRRRLDEALDRLAELERILAEAGGELLAAQALLAEAASLPVPSPRDDLDPLRREQRRLVDLHARLLARTRAERARLGPPEPAAPFLQDLQLLFVGIDVLDEGVTVLTARLELR
ncbi:MAG: hypothetical protein H6742_19280 [Alphaproteobacteria bacterium]|nr:hypothetical protein [Alphaproteobacteria bacterium]